MRCMRLRGKSATGTRDSGLRSQPSSSTLARCCRLCAQMCAAARLRCWFSVMPVTPAMPSSTPTTFHLRSFAAKLSDRVRASATHLTSGACSRRWRVASRHRLIPSSTRWLSGTSTRRVRRLVRGTSTRRSLASLRRRHGGRPGDRSCGGAASLCRPTAPLPRVSCARADRRDGL